MHPRAQFPVSHASIPPPHPPISAGLPHQGLLPHTPSGPSGQDSQCKSLKVRANLASVFQDKKKGLWGQRWEMKFARGGTYCSAHIKLSKPG